MYDINKQLGGVFGEAVGQSGPVFLCGDLFNPSDNLVRNHAFVGPHMDIGIDWWIWERNRWSYGGVRMRGDGRYLETRKRRRTSTSTSSVLTPVVTCFTLADAWPDDDIEQALGFPYVLHGFHGGWINMWHCGVFDSNAAVQMIW